MTSGQIARLAAVSHILYDREVLALRRENESLRQENEKLRQESRKFKLELFWRHHDPKALLFAVLGYAGRHPNVPRGNAIWNIWIEPMLRECGLEVESLDVQVPYHGPPHSDLDTHLVCSSPYHFVAYGAKLCNAASVDDPELLKLKALFDALAAP
jgi:hypothetical protein